MGADDKLQRLRSLMPRGWLPDEAPVADGTLAGFADVADHAAALIAFARAQTRRTTATGGFLDLMAFDLFGLRIRRLVGQSDGSFAERIMREVLRERVTRRGVKAAVEDLTGSPARIVELWSPADCGGYDTGFLAFDSVGRWGSLDHNGQFLLATLQPIGAGIPNVGGFDNGLGGFDTGREEFADLSMVAGPVTDQDIFDTINDTRAAGTTAWVAIGLKPEGRLDVNFELDVSELI